MQETLISIVLILLCIFLLAVIINVVFIGVILRKVLASLHVFLETLNSQEITISTTLEAWFKKIFLVVLKSIKGGDNNDSKKDKG